jgi:tagatose 1,6-diphosphate aldolase GatY/KbaY
MIDGSKLPLEENIALTRSVAELCAAAGVPVEGEIGRVGGKEDDTVCADAGYTIPGRGRALREGDRPFQHGGGRRHGARRL